MEPRKPKLPAEAVQLYNEFIHGHISRREFFDGAQEVCHRRAGSGTIIDALMPNYAAAQQVSKTDERLKTELRDRAVAAWAMARSRATSRVRSAPAT